jgi:hypothetical protein
MNNTPNNHTSPVELAIDLFGGVRKLARALGRDPAAVSRWQKSGVVPTSIQRRLLELAWERGINITAHDIVFGREVND